jgi:signal transduction histidine kinase
VSKWFLFDLIRVSAMTTVPSNIDFATEVKTDRLNTLWRLTLAISIFCCIFNYVVLPLDDSQNAFWVGTPLLLSAASLITAQFLQRGHYSSAAWSYTGGALVAIAFGMSGGGIFFELVPFMFVVAVLIGGLLLKPKSVVIVAGAAVLLTLVVPLLTGQEFFLSGFQLFAILLILLAAGLAAQVTGELYAVTEWALSNYKRERRSNDELYDNRRKLEMSLKRSEALGERLMLTNADLENARTAAETAKKFRGQFLANMSHELRTPLNAIIGFSETMLKFPIMYDDVLLPEAYQADLNQIYNSGTQLLTLINDILDLAKVDAGRLEIQRQVVYLEPIIQSTMATANGLIGNHDIQLVNNLPAPLPLIYADSNRVRQVLLNLYSNAVKFTDAGEIVLTGQIVGDKFRLSVRDTGCGIPQESLDLIFEEFRQANQTERDPRSGAGLGLAISRQLVTMMGGSIWAESEIGKGSTFHVEFPLHKEPASDQDGKSAQAQPADSAVNAATPAAPAASSALSATSVPVNGTFTPNTTPLRTLTVSSEEADSAKIPQESELPQVMNVEQQISQELL